MGLFDTNKKKKSFWDISVFDSDRFESSSSGNWVDWEDVSTGSYDGDGFEHPQFDDEGEY